MANNRLEKLLQFLAEDPNDPFTLYALATEYKKEDNEKALEYFEKLLTDHKDYVGTYYHTAALYDELGDKDNAKITYQKGMKVAREAGNSVRSATAFAAVASVKIVGMPPSISISSIKAATNKASAAPVQTL